MILIQMGDHHAVVHTIKALIDEKEVPFDKLDHYEKTTSIQSNSNGQSV